MVKALPDLSLGEYEKRKLKIISSLGSVYKFRPFLDGAGILRVGGRLQNSSSDYQSKHQLLLPSKHHVTKLLIIDVHQSVSLVFARAVLLFFESFISRPGYATKCKFVSFLCSSVDSLVVICVLRYLY